MYLLFENENSKTLDVILTSKTIQMPPIKTSKVEIEGRDGAIDFTDYFGFVRYGNRTINVSFTSLNPQVDRWEVVAKKWHGKKGKISFSDDLSHYYIGRISLDAWKRHKSTASFEMTIDCEPYRYKNDITTITSGNNTTITLDNEQMPTNPKFTLTGTTKITFGDYSTQLTAGSYIIPAIQLKEGNNSVSFEGNGSITIEYQEGAL